MMLARFGFTLIEMLAVIAIATLVITLAGISIGATSDRTALLRTQAALERMDARARMHARSGAGHVMLDIDSQARIIRLTTGGGQRLSEVLVPEAVEVRVETPNAKPRIAFDARGISDDYAIVLGGEAAGGQTIRLQVLGLTGEIVAQEITQ